MANFNTLDEIYAGVNFHGIPFIPNKAFGSARKLFSQSRWTNAFVYAWIFLLIVGSGEELARLGTRLVWAMK